ncbi:MAG: tyrosine--tRNA ligase [Candidatus Sungbacteria bacterium RIFCSPHIGHO2_02_FULL_52_23]|uniref:Tyrosine--tRNA ligase n=1 Tax=Candidatus Sungbacteria bacterium RIFCSPHIGHO2_02_FULL_52_23 TaxID=1802274 RepID=A0A1G2KVM2_9BACT|nr:MAG: tyrosine--tRNA ligase [Candidatus Sungbacteria bacterium RIFCSPHIGHO2_02_FULL_52_23]
MSTKLSLQSELFTRGVEDIVTREEVERSLKSGRRLRIKLGIDATSPDLHIGHATPLWKIRALQDAGHKAVIILGEFTTRVGDPTGKDATRPVLSETVIKKNIASLKKQLGMILRMDAAHLEIRKNSEWWARMKVGEFFSLLSLVTHARLIEREMFQQRIKHGREIAMTEMLYPILQGYDSVAIKSDMTIIGSDQLFNEHFGRFFQEKFAIPPQTIVSLKILPGLDGGAKMSKSLGNYIALMDTPQDKFGKAMRLIDALIIPYLEVYTDVAGEEIRRVERELGGGGNPRDAKLFFAEALVRRYHGPAIAKKERERFLAVYSGRQQPDEMPEISLREGAWSLVELLVACALAPSKSEARRLVLQKAVEADGITLENLSDPIAVKKGMVIKVGKRKYIRIV